MKILLVITFISNGQQFTVPDGWTPRPAPNMAVCLMWKAAVLEYISNDPYWRVSCERVE